MKITQIVLVRVSSNCRCPVSGNVNDRHLEALLAGVDPLLPVALPDSSHSLDAGGLASDRAAHAPSTAPINLSGGTAWAQTDY